MPVTGLPGRRSCGNSVLAQMLRALGVPWMNVRTAPRAPRAYNDDAPRHTGRMIVGRTKRSAAEITRPARVMPIVVAPLLVAQRVAAFWATSPPDQKTRGADPNMEMLRPRPLAVVWT
jgi:hypothetical protein